MKQLMKRGGAMLLALILCISLFAAFPAEAATVSYVTVNVSGYGQVIKNWGNRGEEATFLSQNAVQFYEDNQTSYAELSGYTGASSTSAVPSSALYSQLKTLMAGNHDEITSYADTKDLYQYTDCQNSGKTTNKISSFYSGALIGPAWDSGSTWNREHTWPNSKGLEGSDEDDIMMLRPTAVSENSSRGNKAYGESSGYYNPNSTSGGKYNLHGDVARIMLYQYVRWGNTKYMWGTSGVMESKDVLLRWMEEDPVDTWELGRNDSVESITGTRNVFVDYPELAFLLFDAEIPTDMTTPSGEAADGGAAYSITAQTSNQSHGTVSVSGRVINASPATGYEVTGYTLVSGTAEITREGNAFTVRASSDCVVRIEFGARSQKTVSYAENAGIAATQTAYSGDIITLPSHKTQVAEGNTFIGWVDHVVEETATAPAYYTAGSKYTVTEDVTFYALYAGAKEGTGLSSNLFEPFTGTLTEGDYIIVSHETDGDYAAKAEIISNRLNFEEVSYTNGNIATTDSSIIWHIAPDGSYWTIYNADDKTYAAGTGVKNKAGLTTSVTDYARWSYTHQSSTYELINKGNDAKGINCRLRKNGNYGFACYSASTGVSLRLYKRASGTLVYFTLSCSHANKYAVQQMDPGCTSVGYTEGIYCPDCEEYLSGYEQIPALGHSYQRSDAQGYVTLTCKNCTDSYIIEDAQRLGDVNDDLNVDDKDALYLLRHVLMPTRYPVWGEANVNGDAVLSDADAVYLLRHTMLPDRYPLYPKAN